MSATDPPKIARRSDGKVCRRTSDGKCRRATVANAACGCGVDNTGPCYVRGKCSFASNFSDYVYAGTALSVVLKVTSPALPLGTEIAGGGWSPPGTAADSYAGGTATGNRWRYRVFKPLGFSSNYVYAELLLDISNTAMFTLELNTYDSSTTRLTHETGAVQGNCSGVFSDIPTKNKEWYDRAENPNNPSSSVVAKPVTWSSGSGTFMLTTFYVCNCGNAPVYNSTTHPATVQAKLENIQVCDCVPYYGSGSSTPNSSLRMVASPNGEYAMTYSPAALKIYDDASASNFYGYFVREGGVQITTYSNTTCSGTGTDLLELSAYPASYWRLEIFWNNGALRSYYRPVRVSPDDGSEFPRDVRVGVLMTPPKRCHRDGVLYYNDRADCTTPRVFFTGGSGSFDGTVLGDGDVVYPGSDNPLP